MEVGIILIKQLKMFRALILFLLGSLLLIQCTQEEVLVEDQPGYNPATMSQFSEDLASRVPCLEFPTLDASNYPGGWLSGTSGGSNYAESIKAALKNYHNCIANPTTEWCGGNYASGGSITETIKYCSETVISSCIDDEGVEHQVYNVPETFNPQTFVMDALSNIEGACEKGCLALPVAVSVTENPILPGCTCGVQSPWEGTPGNEVSCDALEAQILPAKYNRSFNITIDYMCCCIGKPSTPKPPPGPLYPKDH